MTLHVDKETTSVVDLRRTGVFRYAEDPNTHVICIAYQRLLKGSTALSMPEPKLWFPGDPVPPEVIDAIESGERVAAWNAQFEATIWSEITGPRHGWPVPAYDQYECTMSRALYWGLPASLDQAGEALGLPIRKDKVGHALMLRMSRPRAIDDDGTIHWWHEEDPAKRAELAAYCLQDVRSEVAVDVELPPLPDDERAIWLLDQKMNRRGLRVDRDLVDAMGLLVRSADRELREKMQEVTGGAVSGPNATAALAMWLSTQGVNLPDLRKDTLAAAVKSLPDGPAKDAIKLRLEGAKASTAKLKAFKEAVCSDGHARGLLRYCGAGRTRRWSGAGGAKIQPHNMPRGTIKDVKAAIRLIQQGASPDEIAFLFEDSAMGVVASCLRGCFIA